MLKTLGGISSRVSIFYCSNFPLQAPIVLPHFSKNLFILLAKLRTFTPLLVVFTLFIAQVTAKMAFNMESLRQALHLSSPDCQLESLDLEGFFVVTLVTIN